MSKNDQVTIYPVAGRWLDGVPTIEQKLDKDEADALIETGAFTAEKPPEPAPKGKAKDAEPEKAPA